MFLTECMSSLPTEGTPRRKRFPWDLFILQVVQQITEMGRTFKVDTRQAFSRIGGEFTIYLSIITYPFN